MNTCVIMRTQALHTCPNRVIEMQGITSLYTNSMPDRWTVDNFMVVTSR